MDVESAGHDVDEADNEGAGMSSPRGIATAPGYWRPACGASPIYFKKGERLRCRKGHPSEQWTQQGAP
ncbi:MAG TPA: hypothetical protein VN408_34515 [Actinoplanes sp.]|nr:hypothetical protein [Actinoplanes sp.]